MKYLNVRFWMNREYPTKHGYTRAGAWTVATFRIGPLVTGWEVVEG